MAHTEALSDSRVHTTAKRGLGERLKRALAAANQKLTYIIGLPAVGLVGSALVGHFQSMSAYQDKVKAEAVLQISAAEKTFTDVSTSFSKAIALQQILLFNYLDAVKGKADSDERALETKSARAAYQQYDDLRTSLRENIDLLARWVEMDIDWASDLGRDAAQQTTLGADPMSRIALGAYNFDCDKPETMPSFNPGESSFSLPVPPQLRQDNPKAQPLGIDWQSAKHHLLTVYYCFDQNHKRIAVVREWASNSSMKPAEKEQFFKTVRDVQANFDREAQRPNAFMTIAAGAIDAVTVKFRARSWYCHAPFIRQAINLFSNRCLPIHMAEAAAPAG